MLFPAAAPAAAAYVSPGPPQGAAVVLADSPITSESGEVVLRINLPDGYHFTKGANSRYEVRFPTAPNLVTVGATSAKRM